MSSATSTGNPETEALLSSRRTSRSPSPSLPRANASGPPEDGLEPSNSFTPRQTLALVARILFSPILFMSRPSLGPSPLSRLALLCLIVLFLLPTWLTILPQHSTVGLFAYHPPLQSLGVVLLFWGTVILQPTGEGARVKKSKRRGIVGESLGERESEELEVKEKQLKRELAEEKRLAGGCHGVLQMAGTILILAGTTIMIKNKDLHGAPHITSYHGGFGIVTFSLLLFQTLFGITIYWLPKAIYGSTIRAKKLYSIHRILGYFIVLLLAITSLLAVTTATWVVGNIAPVIRKTEIVGIVIGIGGLWVGIKSRKFASLVPASWRS